MGDLHIPKAIWEGDVTILGVTLHCSTLDNGMRVIDEAGLNELFKVLPTAKPEDLDTEVFEAFTRWQRREVESLT